MALLHQFVCKESVNIGDALAKITMGNLDAAAWPASASVDALRDEVEALKKKGVKDPFVYVELGLWLYVVFSALLLLCFHLGKRMTPQWALPLHAASRDGDDGALACLRIVSFITSRAQGVNVSPLARGFLASFASR